jgi:hypothetical protein
MKPRDLPIFTNPDARKVLDAACRKHSVTVTLVRQLMEIQRSYAGSGRADGITTDFEAVLGEFLEESGER